MRPLISGALAAAIGLALAAPVHAQPSGQPDFAHAKELYTSATAAMTEGRYEDAVRDFGGAYDITKDPVLFFKIGEANEKAGHCDVAVIYYGRYLREAKPDPTYVDLTRTRIKACGGAADGAAPAAEPTTPTPASPPTTEPPPAPAEPAPPAPVPPPPVATPAPAPPEAATPPPGGATSGPVEIHGHGRDEAWLLVGGGLAFVTAGIVLAYSAESSEQDLKDLYVGLDNKTPTYDPRTAQRYHDLIDEGKRYQYLSWASFGIAGACAVGATVMFLRSGGHAEKRVTVHPILSPHDAGFAATVRF